MCSWWSEAGSRTRTGSVRGNAPTTKPEDHQDVCYIRVIQVKILNPEVKGQRVINSDPLCVSGKHKAGRKLSSCVQQRRAENTSLWPTGGQRGWTERTFRKRQTAWTWSWKEPKRLHRVQLMLYPPTCTRGIPKPEAGRAHLPYLLKIIYFFFICLFVNLSFCLCMYLFIYLIY